MHTWLQQLAADHHLDSTRARALWRLSRLRTPPEGLTSWMERGLALLAALLLGCGLVFWVAANWQEQTRSTRLLLLEAAVLAPVVLAWAWPRARLAGLLLATLALGALLAFVGQTYQTGADAWQLFVAWAALALPWTLVARSDGLWAMWCLIVGAGLGIWSGMALIDPIMGSVFFRGAHSLVAPIFWAALFMLPLALPRLRLVDQDRMTLAWRVAALLAFAAWCGYGLWGVFSDGQGQVFGWCLVLVAGAGTMAYHAAWRDMVVLGLSLLAGNVLVLAGIARAWFDHASGNDLVATMFVFTAVAALCIGSSGTWLYRLQRKEGAA